MSVIIQDPTNEVQETILAECHKQGIHNVESKIV